MEFIHFDKGACNYFSFPSDLDGYFQHFNDPKVRKKLLTLFLRLVAMKIMITAPSLTRSSKAVTTARIQV